VISQVYWGSAEALEAVGLQEYAKSQRFTFSRPRYDPGAGGASGIGIPPLVLDLAPA
jgi:hypothetical protein